MCARAFGDVDGHVLCGIRRVGLTAQRPNARAVLVDRGVSSAFRGANLRSITAGTEERFERDASHAFSAGTRREGGRARGAPTRAGKTSGGHDAARNGRDRLRRARSRGSSCAAARARGRCSRGRVKRVERNFIEGVSAETGSRARCDSSRTGSQELRRRQRAETAAAACKSRASPPRASLPRVVGGCARRGRLPASASIELERTRRASFGVSFLAVKR